MTGDPVVPGAVIEKVSDLQSPNAGPFSAFEATVDEAAVIGPAISKEVKSNRILQISVEHLQIVYVQGDVSLSDVALTK